MLPSNPINPVCNYGSAAIYKDLPSDEQIRAGVVPLDSLPAAWWNAMWCCMSHSVNQARDAMGALISEIDTVLECAGVCACDVCVNQLYQSIEKIRTTLGNAVTAGAVKSSSCGGQVTIENDGTMTMNGVGNAANLTTSANTIVGAINELKSTYDCCFTDVGTAMTCLDNTKAPNSHVSSATTYGVGNADCYGHLKISDEFTCCVGGAADGLAASQAALYAAYNCLSACSGAPLGNTVGCALGTASAGSCSTAARSDHIHPYPDRLIICNTGCASNWDWNGQSGQPSWLWGSADGINMKVWNPSNFNVNSATYAYYVYSHGDGRWLMVEREIGGLVYGSLI